MKSWSESDDEPAPPARRGQGDDSASLVQPAAPARLSRFLWDPLDCSGLPSLYSATRSQLNTPAGGVVAVLRRPLHLLNLDPRPATSPRHPAPSGPPSLHSTTLSSLPDHPSSPAAPPLPRLAALAPPRDPLDRVRALSSGNCSPSRTALARPVRPACASAYSYAQELSAKSDSCGPSSATGSSSSYPRSTARPRRHTCAFLASAAGSASTLARLRGVRALDPVTAAPLVAGAGPAGRPSSRSADTASQRPHAQGACSFLRHPRLRSPADTRHASSRSVLSCPPRPGPLLAPHNRPARSLSTCALAPRSSIDTDSTFAGRRAGEAAQELDRRNGRVERAKARPRPSFRRRRRRRHSIGTSSSARSGLHLRYIMSLAQQRHHRPPRARSLVPLNCWTTSTNRSSPQAPPTWPRPPPSKPSHQLRLLRQPAAAASLSSAYPLRRLVDPPARHSSRPSPLAFRRPPSRPPPTTSTRTSAGRLDCAFATPAASQAHECRLDSPDPSRGAIGALLHSSSSSAARLLPRRGAR